VQHVLWFIERDVLHDLSPYTRPTNKTPDAAKPKDNPSKTYRLEETAVRSFEFLVKYWYVGIDFGFRV
jgi:hypothetical protein